MNSIKIVLACLIVIILSACSGGGSAPITNSTSAPPSNELQSIVINNLSLKITQGTQSQLSLTAVYQDNSQNPVTTGITWSSSDDSVITISPSGQINAIAPGTATITAEVNGVTSSSTITIEEPILTVIALSSGLNSIALGLDTQVLVTGTFNNGISNTINNIQFSSSDESIATVSESGLVTTLSEGVVTITGELDGISGSIELTVTEVELVNFNIQLDDLEIANGTTTKARATATYSNSTSVPVNVQWQSSDEDIATINAIGGIQALSVGQVQITAVYEGIQSDPITLEVTDAVVVALTAIENDSVALGLSAIHSAELQFSNDTTQPAVEAEWVSSNPNVASIVVVDGVATISGNALGSVTITVSFQGVSTSFTITVTEAVVQSLEFVESEISLPNGTSATASLLANLSDGSKTNVTDLTLFSATPSSSLSIGAVENKEVSFTGLKKGIAQLAGSYKGFTAYASVTITDAIPTALVVEGSASVQFPLGESQQIEVKVEYSDGSKLAQPSGIFWQVSDPTIGSISADGSSIAEVSAQKIGPFDVNVSYLTFNVSFDVFVIGAEAESLSITVPKVFLNDETKRAMAETTYTDDSTRDSTNSVIWTVDDTNIATIDNTSPNHGLISPKGVGSTIVRASYNGGEFFASEELEILPIQLEKGFAFLNYGADNLYTFGTGDTQTTLQFTQESAESISVEVLNGGKIALAAGATNFASVNQADTFSLSSGSVTLTQNSTNSIAVLQNAQGLYGLLQIHDVRLEGVDADSSQVAFSWTVRLDGGDDFSEYTIANVPKLLTCYFAVCTDSELPRFISTAIERNESPKPAQFGLAKFVIIAIGNNYTISNLRADDLNNVSTLSFDGLTNGQVIPEGHAIPFRLLSTPTNGQTADMDFFFNIEEFSDLTFTFQGTLSTN